MTSASVKWNGWGFDALLIRRIALLNRIEGDPDL
jgi:hypothetical protein